MQRPDRVGAFERLPHQEVRREGVAPDLQQMLDTAFPSRQRDLITGSPQHALDEGFGDTPLQAVHVHNDVHLARSRP
jgi:hypothetical protein